MIAALKVSTMRHVVPQTGVAGLTDLKKMDYYGKIQHCRRGRCSFAQLKLKDTDTRPKYTKRFALTFTFEL